MSTTEDFENAPAGTVAREPGGHVAMKAVPACYEMYASWIVSGDESVPYFWFNERHLVKNGYTIVTPTEMTAREHLEAAWVAAHDGPASRKIPAGVEVLSRERKSNIITGPAKLEFPMTFENSEFLFRTLEPLSESEPYCEAYRDGYQCSREPGHDGPHVAATAPLQGTVCEVWGAHDL